MGSWVENLATPKVGGQRTVLHFGIKSSDLELIRQITFEDAAQIAVAIGMNV
jgi:hypothetical protein